LLGASCVTPGVTGFTSTTTITRHAGAGGIDPTPAATGVVGATGVAEQLVAVACRLPSIVHDRAARAPYRFVHVDGVGGRTVRGAADGFDALFIFAEVSPGTDLFGGLVARAEGGKVVAALVLDPHPQCVGAGLVLAFCVVGLRRIARLPCGTSYATALASVDCHLGGVIGVGKAQEQRRTVDHRAGGVHAEHVCVGSVVTVTELKRQACFVHAGGLGAQTSDAVPGRSISFRAGGSLRGGQERKQKQNEGHLCLISLLLISFFLVFSRFWIFFQRNSDMSNVLGIS